MRVSGQSSAVVSQWRGTGNGKQTKTIGKLEAVQAIERESGFSALWLAKGMGPKRAANWTPPQHAPKGVIVSSVAQDLSQPQFDDDPTTCTWEFILSTAASGLPKRFKLAMPDDALSPHTPRGVVLIFSTGQEPIFGHGVLVEDAAGQRYVRRYAQGPAGRWIADVHNNAYLALDSAEGLKVLAVVTGRETGEA